jgi:hypothetical protein
MGVEWKLQLRSIFERLTDQSNGFLSSSKTGLVAIATVTVIMNHRDAIDVVNLDPWTAFSHGPQADAVSDDVQGLDASPARERGVQRNAPRHDADGQVGVRLRFPRAFLEASAKNGSTTCGTLGNK